MALRFVEQCDTHSVYQRPDGTLVLVAHGFPRRYLVEFDKDEMVRQWHAMVRQWHAWPVTSTCRDGFLAHLRNRLTDPDIADDVRWCANCASVDLLDDGETVDGNFVCSECYDNEYSTCDNCHDLAHNDSITGTLDDSYVCDDCLGSYSWCNECDGYYPDDYADDHDHDDDGSGCCESPAPDFTIRNDGVPPLANDTRVTISLPAGVIDTEGVQRIRRAMQLADMYDASCLLPTLGDKWQTREGNYTKRLSRAIHKTLAQKISPDLLSEIGNIARAHSTPVDFEIETTRRLNMSAADFYHEDSCWWQSYSEGRCTLKTNGGFGLRTFTGDSVTGRAWVLPLKLADGRLTPTFDTVNPSAFVVFNGYGRLEGYTAARILSHMAGWTYRRVGLSCSPMFINSDAGYLVAPEDIAAPYTDGRLDIATTQHSALFTQESTHTRELAHV